jgi:NAD(P)-dependent dehydrogenase (short-subunit alcohol dehydrogenase family)
MRYDGRVAIVTGAASRRGIGQATALTLARGGADLVIGDVDLAGAERLSTIP